MSSFSSALSLCIVLLLLATNICPQSALSLEALMDQQTPYQRQIRSLANGRWQLRPGKRSSAFLDQFYGPGLGAREMRRPVGMGYVLLPAASVADLN